MRLQIENATMLNEKRSREVSCEAHEFVLQHWKLCNLHSNDNNGEPHLCHRDWDFINSLEQYTEK